jgi:hypothetical protein
MRAYTVHAPPGEPAAPEKFAFVKDGISWPALFVPILWILWHRLWLALIGYIIFVLAIAWTELLVGEDAAAVLAILGAILFALEANNIRRLALDRRGWRDVGSTFGQNLDEAEMRYFEKQVETAAPVKSADRERAIARAAYREPERHDRSDEPIFGLFPEPER